MFVKGKVLTAKTEKRDLVGKDGLKRNYTIHHVVLLSSENGENEVLNCKTFNENYILPKVGEVVSLNFRKYDNSTGVADVSF